MRRFCAIIFLALTTLVPLVGCDVHEFPEVPDNVIFHLRLDYEKDITIWEHLYNDPDIIDQGKGEIYDNSLSTGKMRYIIRAYPQDEYMDSSLEHLAEFVFSRDIAEGYDSEYTLELPVGDYKIMVWSDIVLYQNDTPYYNADNFGEIVLQGEYVGNTNYRDAFRGSIDISLTADIYERIPDTYNIVMQRPLAKYEFITNDVEEFIIKESSRLAGTRGEDKESNKEASSDPSTRAINIEDYKVVLYYQGFMHDTYNMYDDKPVDSRTGMKFETTLKSITNKTASLGFDYAFVNGLESSALVQIGIYDKQDSQLSLTDPIKVPLKRNHHTILRGSFLMSETSGSLQINPDFDGDHNVQIH